jgi:hypothetical protein
MVNVKRLIILLALVTAPFHAANAALITATGSVTTNDVGVHNFSLSAADSVDIWELSTRDFRLGIFDNIGSLVGGNDDRGVFPGQNIFDATVLGLNLSAGDYTAVVSYWTNFSETLDGYGINATGGSYTINIQGANVLATPAPAPGPARVPAPATLALMGLGLAGLGWKRRKA